VPRCSSAINDSGQIVGWADTQSGAQHAASWIGTKVTDLGTLVGGTNSYASAVNTSGEIVGAVETSSGTQHAALFIGGQVVDLNAALSFSLPDYITLTDAAGINDSHLIVANGVDSRTGNNRAFLLTPSTEVLNCVQGENFYRVVKPSNSVSSSVSPNSAGNPSICAVPSSKPLPGTSKPPRIPARRGTGTTCWELWNSGCDSRIADSSQGTYEYNARAAALEIVLLPSRVRSTHLSVKHCIPPVIRYNSL
jgi:probable HAF family extracellular repeat protein